MDILYAWIASIASALMPLTAKAMSKSLIKNPWLYNVLFIASRIPLVVVFALLTGGWLPDNWWPLIALGTALAGFYMFFTLSVYRLDVTTVAPLFALRAVFAVLLGVMALGEFVSPLMAGLMTVIVIMIPFAAYSEKLRFRSFVDPSILLAVAAMACLALAGYFTNVSVAQNGYASTILLQDTVALAVLLPTLAFVPKSERTVSFKTLLPFAGLAVAGFAFVASSTLAFANNLALSSIIVSLPLSMVFAWLLSKRYSQFFESHTRKVYVIRFLGAGVMVTCAIWLSFL